MNRNTSMPTAKEEGLISGGLSYSQKQNMAAAASGLAQIGSSVINYSSLKAENAFAEVNAGQIELQAQQQANMLRENFNEAVGNDLYSASRRGVDVKSGSVRSGQERAAKNLGEDITTMKRNAGAKARTIRAQASINKRMAKAQMVSGIAGGISSTMTNWKS